MPPINRTLSATSRMAASSGLGFVAVILATTVTASADTFADALEDAYAYNTDLASARAHLRGVDEQVPQALAGWRPTVTLNTGAGYTTFGTGTSHLIPAEFAYEQWGYGGNLQIKLPLYSGYGTVAAVERAEATVRAAAPTCSAPNRPCCCRPQRLTKTCCGAAPCSRSTARSRGRSARS